jgi:hypothetical protein
MASVSEKFTLNALYIGRSHKVEIADFLDLFPQVTVSQQCFFNFTSGIIIFRRSIICTNFHNFSL